MHPSAPLRLCVILSLLAATTLAGPLAIERMTEQESRTTILDEGEMVAVIEPDGRTVQLRYGDGENPGGIIIADPFSLKTAYFRPLARAEYTIRLEGRTTATNGIYQLITPRAAASYDADNAGSLIIAPRLPITLLADVQYGIRDYSATVTVTPLPAFIAGATNLTIAAAQLRSTPIDGGTARAAISNMVVYGWVGTHLIGSTNDCRGTMLLVRAAQDPGEPISLAEHNRLLADHRAEDWSLYAATQAVDLAWQDLWLSPYARLTGTARGADLAITTPFGTTITNAISVQYMGQACTIVGYSLGVTSVTLWVESSIAMTNTPVIQSTATLTNGSWSAVSTTSTWPTDAWYASGSGRKFRVWEMSTPRTPGVTQFYRIWGYPGPATNSVTINLPLVPAAGITFAGTNVSSWAELKALLESMP